MELQEQLAAIGNPFPQWLAQRRESCRQYVEANLELVAQLADLEPTTVEETLRVAKDIMHHQFDLLGSGPYRAVDPERATVDGYQPIDWYLDPVRGVRFPRGVPYREWNLMEMRPGDADIKYPWELARCQHLVTLGQAWRLSGDRRYALEVLREIEDFTQANPVGIGINWTCTMDVAIRAANWTLALALVKHFDDEDESRLAAAYQALFEHGQFIFDNLENHYEVTSNHFLSNVVGLQLLAAEFPELPCAADWDRFCRASVEQEIEVQVLSDGADFESSLPYHRLVTELFLASARLAQLQQRPLSSAYHSRLASMLEFQLGVMRPDMLTPQIGDADDGRLHIFSGYGTWERRDARHLFAPAALTLDRPEWLAFAGPQGRWEAGWWGFSVVGLATSAASAPPVVRMFPEAGIFVVRRERVYLAITNGCVGTRGFGNHKHNDLLGFEYHVDGQPLFVDPGSYVYTSDFSARNLFRSTAYHNTVTVDHTEQNELNPEWLFRLFEKADPQTVTYSDDGEHVAYTGRHTGYRRLPDPVTHQRTFAVYPTEGSLEIEDSLGGAAKHKLVWHFHLAPGVGCTAVSAGHIRLDTSAGRYAFLYEPALQLVVNDAWYSPGYGARVATKALEFSLETRLGKDTGFGFRVSPESTGTTSYQTQLQCDSTETAS